MVASEIPMCLAISTNGVDESLPKKSIIWRFILSSKSESNCTFKLRFWCLNAFNIPTFSYTISLRYEYIGIVQFIPTNIKK